MGKGIAATSRVEKRHPALRVETIHPFADGNGRMGRLWQTLLLAKWNALFAWIPMESILHENRPHRAIEDARKANDSGAFIEFTLSAILDSIALQERHQDEHIDEHQVKHQVEWSATQLAVLKLLEERSLSRKEIFAALQLTGDSRAFKRHIEPLLAAGLVKMTIPDKQQSSNQRYIATRIS